MDAIIDFVVDGIEVEREEQTVEVLMRLPQYSRRVNWTRLYHYVRSIRTHGSIRAQQTIRECVGWMLEPIHWKTPLCNVIVWMSKGNAGDAPFTKMCVAAIYSYVYDSGKMLETILAPVKHTALAARLQVLFGHAWVFRQTVKKSYGDPKIALMAMHQWSLGARRQMTTMWHMLARQDDAQMVVDYLVLCESGREFATALCAGKHMYLSNKALTALRASIYAC